MMNRTTTLLQLVLGLCFFLALPANASSAAEAKVTAQLATGVVKFGGVVICKVQVEGAKSASLEEIPEIEGLRLEQRSGPTINESRSFINGRFAYSRTLTWVVTFRPEAQGDFVIPPMRLTVDGKTLFTSEQTLSVVEDMTGQELGYLEFFDVPERVYEGQPFTIRMNFGWDTKLDSMVNVANLILPWWNELPGTLEVESELGGLNSPMTEVQVNSRARARALNIGEQTVRGKPFRVLQVTRSYVATRAGTLSFPQSWLEFGHIRRSAFSAQQKETYHVGVPAFTIVVRTLPESGRPPEFSGGVGTFEVQADVNRRDIDLGESIKLTVDWTGSANLEFFELPNPARLDAFEDFRVYGTTNERFYGDRRRVVYDLAPKSASVGEIPPLPLVVFDPKLESYITVETQPIPIRVRAIEGVMGLEDIDGDGKPALAARDIQGPEDVQPASSGLSSSVLAVAWVGVPFLWLLARTRVRRRGDPAAPAARRRRAARRKLNRQLARASSAKEQALALHEFLAARSGELPTAWEGRDLEAWSTATDREVSEQALREYRAVARRLDERRWAGDDSKLEDNLVLSMADTLIGEGL